MSLSLPYLVDLHSPSSRWHALSPMCPLLPARRLAHFHSAALCHCHLAFCLSVPHPAMWSLVARPWFTLHEASFAPSCLRSCSLLQLLCQCHSIWEAGNWVVLQWPLVRPLGTSRLRLSLACTGHHQGLDSDESQLHWYPEPGPAQVAEGGVASCVHVGGAPKTP